ncbi:MAG: hypothetical protein HC918_00925 [Oscillatoriales cyanobacterium SM2_1_8]|nr:hypothetical protein [Oscillatoriales cyanobacterium SM2_1_8]
MPDGATVGQAATWQEALSQVPATALPVVCGSLYLVGDVLQQLAPR